MCWALYQQDKELRVGKLLHPGVRTFVQIDRKGRAERINRVHVQGIFDTDDQALAARKAAYDASDLVAGKAAIKASTGYRPLP